MLFEPPFERIMGNVRTSSIARGRLPIPMIEHFSSALTVETLSADIG